MRLWLWAHAFLIALLGCDSPPTDQLDPVGAEWTLGEAKWRTDEAVALTEVVGAVLLRDGRVVVADATTSLVHFLSREGARSVAVGGDGDGPGEFRSIESIGRWSGDSLWVHDFSHQRVSFLSLEPRVVRSVNLRPRLGSGRVVGLNEDGSVVAGEAWSSARVASADHAGFSRENVAYVSFGPDGSLRDTIALMPGRELVLRQEDGRGVMSPAPLGRAAVHTLVGGRLVLGDQVSRELSVHLLGDSESEALRLPQADLVVTPTVASEWRRAMIAEADGTDLAMIERIVRDADLPTERPAYGEIIAGGMGDVWVADFSMPGKTADIWFVVSVHQGFKARVRMPPNFRPLDILGDTVLGVVRDAYGVPSLELRVLARE